jgi:hypothetical protein
VIDVRSTLRSASVFAVAVIILAAFASGPDHIQAEDGATSDSMIERTIDDYVDLSARRARLTAREDRPVPNSALPPGHLDTQRFPTSLVDGELIVAGGPPPDGIPATEEPVFASVGDVDWLDPTEAVLVLDHAGEAHAYPIRVLIWHEIVNATIAELPVAIT